MNRDISAGNGCHCRIVACPRNRRIGCIGWKHQRNERAGIGDIGVASDFDAGHVNHHRFGIVFDIHPCRDEINETVSAGIGNAANRESGIAPCHLCAG